MLKSINRVGCNGTNAGKHEWQITQELAKAMGYEMNFNSSEEIMDEIAELTQHSLVSFQKLDKLGSVQWPCNDKETRRNTHYAC